MGMDMMQPKANLNLCILKIMQKYSDEEHRLSQKDIAEYLEKDFSMMTDRKAIKRHLMNLTDFGFPINCTEKQRIGKEGEEEIVCTDWYLEPRFMDAELRLLVDGLLFSNSIPEVQCKQLIEKLEGLANKHFSSRVKHIRNIPSDLPRNKQMLYTVEVLDEAISAKKQVMFTYNEYDIDKKMHPRKTEDGTDREYIINPYQIVATNGRYYLICNHNSHDNVANYRLDRITDIVMLDTKAKPMKNVKGLERGLDLPKHMAEHIYMFTGESVTAKFRAQRRIVSDIIDWFGLNVKFSNATGDEVDVTVQVNEQAFFCWALQFGMHIEVLEPDSTRQALKSALGKMHARYC